MASIGPMEVEWSEFSKKMIGCSPNLDMRVMGDSNVPIINVFTILWDEEDEQGQPKTYFPSGENLMSFIGLWKLKWWSTIALLAFTSNARPSINKPNMTVELWLIME